jgi:hypothetical protein
MINFSFNIDNPRPKSNGLESIDYILTEKKISKNWAFECQLTNERSWNYEEGRWYREDEGDEE